MINLQKFSIGLYLVLAFIIVPVLSPLRAMGLWEPATLRNLLLPVLLVIILVSFGGIKPLVPRSVFQLVILIIFVQSMVRGISNDILLKDYFSHLFQLFSAYCMFGAGWLIVGKLDDSFWRLFAILSLLSILVSTVVTLWALSKGVILRFYIPTYTLLLPVSYGLIYSPGMFVVAFIAILVSNKRGPIISSFIMYITKIIFSAYRRSYRGRTWGGSLMKSRRAVFVVYFVVVAFLIMRVISIPIYSSFNANTLTRAVNITYNRVALLVKAVRGEEDLDYASSGRVEEVRNTLKALRDFDYVFGAGAGWTVSVEYKKVHNIHFTPLSLTAVFGAPFAIFLYVFLFTIAFRGLARKNKRELSATERIAPFYLLGAIVHSFVAYSLFIDFLVAFFAGVLVRSLYSEKGMHNLQSDML